MDIRLNLGSLFPGLLGDLPGSSGQPPVSIGSVEFWDIFCTLFCPIICYYLRVDLWVI